ncbi:hypothetical protein ACHAPJ_006253 [Fusarium lateritium]
MDEEQDTRPTSSPYASDVCAVYFKGDGPLYMSRQLLHQSAEIASRNTAKGFASSPGDLHFDDISLDTGHVLIHFLVTKTYQCLKPREVMTEKKYSSELATALRVYVAADTLNLPALRDLARKEIIRLGDQLGLAAMIKVMEESSFSFDAVPGVVAYIESRILSFSESTLCVDTILADLGTPNTLSKVLLRSMILMKASGRAKKQEPTFAGVVGKTPGQSQIALLLRPVEEAMKQAEEQAEERAEQQAIREAEELAVARETTELKGLQNKRTLKGKLTSREKRKLAVLQENAARRAQAQEAREVEEAEVALSEEKPGDEFDPLALPEVEEAEDSSPELDVRSSETIESSTMKSK